MKTRPLSAHEMHWQRAGRAVAAGGYRGAVSRMGAGDAYRYAGRIHWPRTLAQGRPLSENELVHASRRHAANELWLIMLDASASTARHGALSKAKGVMRSLLAMAYHERIAVALLEASGNGPQWRAKAQRPPKVAGHWVDDIGAGGGTPLQDALADASAWLARRSHRYPQEIQRVFLLTDGRVRTLPSVQIEQAHVLLIDIESGALRLEKSRALATLLDANYVHIDQLTESELSPEFP